VEANPPPRRPAASEEASALPTPPAASTVRITERDRLLLAFAAEHRFVLCTHVQSLLAITPAAAYARLRALRDAGYLQGERKLHDEPGAYQITRDGLRAAGSDLSRPRKIDLATYRHDSGVAWLMLAARHGRFGPLQQIVSERRMRSLDARSDRRAEPFGVRLGGIGPGGRERLHYPDLLILTAEPVDSAGGSIGRIEESPGSRTAVAAMSNSGYRVAFELELSSKSRSRREGILAGYAADPRIDAVVYLVDRPDVGRAVSRSAARLGASSLVHVQNLSWGGAETPVQHQPAVRVAHQAAGRPLGTRGPGSTGRQPSPAR
jgi:DNA-binding PadR family transcriptional regulator